MPRVVSDAFNRADNVSTLGNADTGQAWTVRSTWGISTNQAYENAVAAGGDAALIAISAAVNASFTLGVTFSVIGVSQRLVWRSSDGNNEVFLQFAPDINSPKLYKRAGGVVTQLASAAATGANGDKWKVVILGNTFTAYQNDTQQMSATDSFNSSILNIGIGSDSGLPAASRWDDFFCDTQGGLPLTFAG